MNITIFGLGNVGSGTYNIFLKKKKKILTFSINNKYNCILYKNFLNYKLLFFLNNLFIELIGNINIAFEIILNCLKYNNNLITANKEIISKYYFFLNFLYKINNKKIFFEASICGCLPLIIILQNCYFKEKLNYYFSILNGTNNYILSNIKKNVFLNLIKNAIKNGFSEKNYNNDILGIDSNYKSSILFSYFNNYYNIFYLFYLESIYGINNIIKNIIYEKKHISYCFIINNYYFYGIHIFLLKNFLFIKTKNSYNSILINLKYSKKNFFLSKGAGSIETSSSIINNYFEFFNKKFFNKNYCFDKFIMLKKYYNSFRFLIIFKNNYNFLFFFSFFKIKILKILNNNNFYIKLNNCFYKKILIILNFIKNKIFFILKIL